jgi:hypothetical protein
MSFTFPPQMKRPVGLSGEQWANRQATAQREYLMASQPFPFTASINEPQTVSLPVPENVTVPVPVIEALEPAYAAIGGEDFTLVVSGDNFFADSVINFAGQDEPTTFDAGTLSTIVKPSLWVEPTTVDVLVKNGPAVSGPIAFEFTAPAARKRK